MQADFDCMDMFTLWESDYIDAGIWMMCKCGDSIHTEGFPGQTLGDLYFAAAKHLKEKHEC